MTGVTWQGLEAFKHELATLTPQLEAEARAINLASAEAAYAQIFQTYPRGATGNLRGGLRLRHRPAGSELRQRAPHGHLYEYGTTVRTNKAGANRGYMKPHPTFYPIATTHQQHAIDAIIRRLYASGAVRVQNVA